ncbi:MAG TPA: hypothetical protein PK677_16410 [Acidiphilium sp.]|uniref:hypothetical protein n=1 Tax=unclassified Acidiphilium TaxID=2617493 RepID=UPI0025807F1A|nr:MULTISPECIES: hypothetical protein [unclassified Acidiphilium]HQT90093.1 hypothetical protein [Acidiphilium sp.]
MTTVYENQNDEIAIAKAIASLKSKQPKQRSRRAAIAPHVDDIKALIASGWTRSEIIGEMKAMGCQISPSLLRDVLGIPPKPKRPKKSK